MMPVEKSKVLAPKSGEGYEGSSAWDCSDSVDLGLAVCESDGAGEAAGIEAAGPSVADLAMSGMLTFYSEIRINQELIPIDGFNAHICGKRHKGEKSARDRFVCGSFF